MIIKSLKLKNFMLYKDLNLNFEGKSVIAITCKYSSDPSRSNRGGKTTIIEAIHYGLFGTSRANKETELIHHNQDEMEVEIILNHGDKDYTITRGRNSKNKGYLECNWETKKKESQLAIEEILGFNKQEFELTCFFKQADINQFMNLSSNDKKKHLMQWLENNHWQKMEEEALNDLNNVKKEVNALKNTIGLLETEKVSIKHLNEKLEIYTKALSGYKKLRIKYSEKNQNNLSVKYKLKAEKNNLSNMSSELSGQVVHLDKKKHLKTQLEKVQKILLVSEEIGPLLKLGAKLTQLIKDLKNKITNAEENFCGQCPVLNESCDRIKPNNKKIMLWDKKKTEFKKKLSSIHTRITKAKENDKAAFKANSLKNELAYIKVSSKEVNALEVKIEAQKLTIKKIEETFGDNSLTKEKLSNVITKEQDALTSIGKIEERIAMNKRIKEKIKKLKDELDEKTELKSDLNYISKMFGKNGIPGQEIENAFSEIQEQINFVLEKMGTGISLTFQADKELSTWEDDCFNCGKEYPKGQREKKCNYCGNPRNKKRKDDFRLNIVNGDNSESGFHMESGGGKVLVSLAVRLALTKIIQERTGSPFNVIFLDEPDSSLDEFNKEAFMDIVSRVLVNDFGIEQCFWITHSKNINESIPNVIQINRHENHSEALWL